MNTDDWNALGLGHMAPRLDPEKSILSVLGIELEPVDDETIRAVVPVTDRIRQPMALVHGGVYGLIAETVASVATARLVYPDGLHAFGASYSTNLLRPISAGSIHALGTLRHRGRTTLVWNVDMSDDEGRLCAVTLMTMAVRPDQALRPEQGDPR